MTDDQIYKVFLTGTEGDEGTAVEKIKRGLRAVWLTRRMIDADICRRTDECLDPSANPDHFAKAIEAIE